jgi:hypothetical protein
VFRFRPPYWSLAVGSTTVGVIALLVLIGTFRRR